MQKRRITLQLQQAHMMFLKCFQRLGYFPGFSGISLTIRERIARSIEKESIEVAYVESIPNATMRRLELKESEIILLQVI